MEGTLAGYIKDLSRSEGDVQNYGHRLIHIPMRIEFMSQKVDEVLKILPDLHKGLTDLRAEITDLKRNQWENLETSRSRQERIRDALGTVPLYTRRGRPRRFRIQSPETI